jgi:hypothetical protein
MTHGTHGVTRPINAYPIQKVIGRAGSPLHAFKPPGNYLLANTAEITQNELIMKPYSLLIGIIVTAVTGVSSLAQDKASLQPNATILSALQGNTGKNVELRMQCGEKIGGKVEQVNENVVLLSHLTGAEYFDGVVNLKDISAVITRSAGK